MIDAKNYDIGQFRQQQLIRSSYLLIAAFSTAFFPRILSAYGAPSFINFFHFLAIPVASFFVLLKTKVQSQKQINICSSILLAQFLLLTVTLASALLNSAGIINVVLDNLLLVEPYMLLVAIISLPKADNTVKRLSIWLERFILIHLFLIYVQKIVLGYCGLPGQCDNIQGVFYRSGSGHVVGASVSVSFALHYFMDKESGSLTKRTVVLIAGLGNILTSDAKQVLLTFIIAFFLIFLTQGNLSRAIQYVAGSVVFLLIFWWAIYNIEALSAFNTWIRPEIYGPDGEATKLKFSGIQISLTHFSSPLNWFLGLGPGHTVDRLGGWMLRDYESLLAPLGSTNTGIGKQVWRYVGASWLAEGSSMFSPFWGWAAIWGDIGFIGLASYLYLASLVWRKICLDDVSRILVLSVMVHGFIFTQLEEPGYMLCIAMLLGIRWHKYKT